MNGVNLKRVKSLSPNWLGSVCFKENHYIDFFFLREGRYKSLDLCSSLAAFQFFRVVCYISSPTCGGENEQMETLSAASCIQELIF